VQPEVGITFKMSKTRVDITITLSTTHKNPNAYASAMKIGNGR